MDLEVLEEIGLEKDEVKVYLALLKLGSITATKVASETKIYRTNVYRLLDSLISKGFVSYILKNNVKYFSASNPKKLLDDHKRKEDNLKKIIPALESLALKNYEDVSVEVFKGKEGLISVLKYILRTGKDYFVFGEEGKFQEVLPVFIEQFLRDLKHFGLKEKILSKESLKKKIILTKNSNIRYLHDKFFSPTMTVVFGSNVAIFTWEEPYHAILIKSKSMALSYKSYFEGLWSLAKK